MTDSKPQAKPNQTILVVDNSRVFRKVVNTMLASHYKIIEVENARTALSFVIQNPSIHAILLPEVDGPEVLKALRSSPISQLQNLPVIVVTGDPDNSERQAQAISLGATALIGKPFSADELRDKVGKHILPKHNEAILARHADFTRQGEALLQNAVKTHRPISTLRLKVDRANVLLSKTGMKFTKRTLYRIGKLIEAELRRKDLTVRLGAADFAVMLPNTSHEEAKAVAEAIFRILRYTAFGYGDLKFRLTVSGGLATPSQQENTSFEALLNIADQRADTASSLGGDQLISNESDERLSENKNALSFDQATELLRAGKTREVGEQLPELLEKTMPLLIFANSALDLNISTALRALKATTDDVNKAQGDEAVVSENLPFAARCGSMWNSPVSRQVPATPPFAATCGPMWSAPVSRQVPATAPFAATCGSMWNTPVSRRLTNLG